MKTTTDADYVTLDEFDRAVEMLRDLPDCVATETTLHLSEPLTGRKATTYIVRRFRRSQEGDTVFLTVVAGETAKKIILPPRVMAAFARQDAALSTKLRVKNGRRQAADRKAQGIQPAFLKKVGA
jgi:hypothetical protein